MNNYLKNIAKAACLLGAIGVALSLIVPTLAEAVISDPKVVDGIINSSTLPFLGGYFAAFGALRAGLQPLVDRVFGDATVKESIAKERGITQDLGVSLALENEQCHCNHVENLNASRTLNTSFQRA